MRFTFAAIFLFSSVSHASVVVTSVDISAVTTASSYYQLIDPNTGTQLFNTTDPKSFSITTPATTSNTITSFAPPDITPPEGVIRLYGPSAFGRASVDLDLTNGVNFQGSTFSSTGSLNGFGGLAGSFESSAKIDVLIEFQVLNAPAILSFSETLQQITFEPGPPYANGYSLLNLDTGEKVLDERGGYDAVTQIPKLLLEPGRYSFTQEIFGIVRNGGPGDPTGSASVSLVVIPEVNATQMLMVAIAIGFVVVRLGRSRGLSAGR